jgi:hypothetical protein
VAQAQQRSFGATYGVRLAQAAGMVTAQAGCTISTAEILMQYRAELIGCSVGDIALAVVNRRVRSGVGVADPAKRGNYSSNRMLPLSTAAAM